MSDALINRVRTQTTPMCNRRTDLNSESLTLSLSFTISAKARPTAPRSPPKATTVARRQSIPYPEMRKSG